MAVSVTVTTLLKMYLGLEYENQMCVNLADPITCSAVVVVN